MSVPLNATAFREVVETGIRNRMDEVDRLIRTPEGRAKLAEEQRVISRRHLRNADDPDLMSRPWPKREDYLRWAREHEEYALGYERMTGNKGLWERGP
jgi:hypothetical protein